MFELHDKLAEDTIPIGGLTLSRILLMNNSDYPWVILVPERTDVSEIIDLTLSERITLMAEISLVSDVIKKTFQAEKLNVANLGNQVSQLHVHIIARFSNDNAWPDPVWGKGGVPYADDKKQDLVKLLQEKFMEFDEFAINT